MRVLGFQGLMLLCATVIVGGCTEADSNLFRNTVVSFDSENFARTPFSCSNHSLNWQDVDDWYYQLQNMDFAQLAQTQYDLIVMDSEPRVPLNSNVIDRIRCDGNGEKLVLAYLPIGKAEDFRNYWQEGWGLGNPAWLAKPNLGWEGEYLVRYWDTEWQNIIYGSEDSRLDVIIEAGFDGVVLDAADVYNDFLDENPNAVVDMHSLITDIRDYAIAQTGNSNFGVFVQNTEEQINNTSIDWLSSVTGIIKQSHWFESVDRAVAPELSVQYEQDLSQWISAGKPVLTVDYSVNSDNIRQVYEFGDDRGYVPLVVPSIRLDSVSIPEGYEPD